MRTISLMVSINIDDSFDPLPEKLDQTIATAVRRTLVSSIENGGELVSIYPTTEFYYGRVTVVPVRRR